MGKNMTCNTDMHQINWKLDIFVDKHNLIDYYTQNLVKIYFAQVVKPGEDFGVRGFYYKTPILLTTAANITEFL